MLQAGTRLGPYEIVAPLGAGGMGEVYRAKDTRLGREVALKTLPAALDATPSRLARLRKEARILASLSHPHVATLFGLEETDGATVLVMELVDGPTLANRLRRGPLGVSEALELARQIAEGLEAAHEKGVLYRDLKPGNVALTPKDQVKLLDFGLAKAVGEDGPVDSQVSTGTSPASEAGAVVGTAPYMSPEQARGEEVDRRTDVWAFGCVLYEMLAGKRAFPGTTWAEAVSAVMGKDPDWAALPAETPPNVRRLLERCLQKDKERRLRDIADARLEVEECILPRARTRRRKDKEPRIERLAVLPLTNLTGDPRQEYFVEGMHDALITQLARIGALTVISRQSVLRYRETEKSVPEIARELGVDAVIEGSVFQAGDTVRITAQLLRARPAERHLWAGTYEKDLRDVLALQANVAQAIASEINVTVKAGRQARLTRVRTVNPEAYQLCLKGNFLLEKQSETAFRQALEHFRQAIEIDPSFAPAYAGRAVAYIELGSWASSLPPGAVHAQARAAALDALERDSTMAEAHIALARIKQLFEWDWAGAEAAYQRGIALNPTATHALTIYANYLMSMGRLEEAVAIGRRIVERDPLSPYAYMTLGWALDHVWRDAKALEEYQKALELAPDLADLQLALAEFHLDRGRLNEASRHAMRADNLLAGAGSPAWMGRLGYIHARLDHRAHALRILDELRTRAEREYVPPVAFAVIYIGLDQKEEALELLEQAYEKRDVILVWLKVRRHFDPLRDHPRFQRLLKRMNYPE